MASALGNSVAYANNSYIDGLVQGGKWSTGNLTYSLWETEYGAWNDYSKSIIDAALQQFENVANISFTYQETYGYPSFTSDLSFLFTGDVLGNYYNALAMAMFPDPVLANQRLVYEGISRSQWPNFEGSILLDNYQYAFQYGAAPGGSGFQTIIHEIGHAIGLKHPHDDGGTSRPEFSELGMSSFDNQLYTMMSYNAIYGSSTSFGNPATPMPLDILALQHIYGANMSYNNTDTVYTISDANDSGVVETIWDAGGIDLMDGSTATLDLIFDLREGEWSQIGSTYGAIAYNVIIENAYGGSGSDLLIGNAVGNTLKGFSGNDTIYGAAGDDWINGNAGIDILLGEAGNDKVRGGKNIDGIDGGEGDDFLNGNNDMDVVNGGAGNDTVHGGKSDDFIYGDAGNDFMYGDLGNDELTGGTGADTFVFRSNSGIDTITDFVTGTDTLQIHSSIYATAAQAVSAFSGGVLDLGGGNMVTLTGVNSIAESDILIG